MNLGVLVGRVVTQPKVGCRINGQRKVGVVNLHSRSYRRSGPLLYIWTIITTILTSCELWNACYGPA